MHRFTVYIIIISFLASGCSKTPKADDNFVACTIDRRIDCKVEWRHGRCQDAEILAFIEEVIANELTADAAIQIALLNNPKIQATFEELGIAQADLLEAGLLSNPSFEIEVRYPHSSRLHTNIEYLLTSSLLDLVLIPLRTQLASTEFEQTKLRVANDILNLAFEVRETFYELIAEESKVVYLQSIAGLTGIIGDLFKQQNALGNVNSLEFQIAQSRFLEADLEKELSQTEVIRLKEKLSRLLGFSESLCLMLPKDLPEEMDYPEYDLCFLETIALEERIDLQVARIELARLSQMLGLKNWWAYTNFRAGLAGERELEGMNVMGPGVSGELPIFNYGQAARMRLFAELRQAKDRLSELEIKVLSEVREAQAVLLTFSKIVTNYKNRLLPMQTQISLSSEELYNVMGIGVDKLLENKRQEVIARKNYTEGLKRYLVSKVELDRALGGNLPKLVFQQDCLLENIND